VVKLYVIAVYDVSVERVQEVCNLLKKYLHWKQRSVFEGELKESQIISLERELKNIIDPSYDQVILFIFRDKKYVKKKIIGQKEDLEHTDNIIVM